jgi:hypothetical protein
MIERKSWEEFKATKLLWWVNRILHTFGWAIILDIEENGRVIAAYPARVKFRGFSEESETDGFIGLTEHLQETINDLAEEVHQ